MALVNADFVQPTGRLQAAWFPSDTLDTLLTAWLAQAVENTADVDAADREAAQVTWVYYRAFSKLADDLLIQPAQQTTGPRSEQFTDTQLARWQAQASHYLSEYQTLTGVGPINSFEPVF